VEGTPFHSILFGKGIMKIAVTAKGAGLGAWLDPNFADCPQIVIVDDRDRFEAWANPFRGKEPNDGTALAAKLIQEQVAILITGIIPAQALDNLQKAGITVYQAEKGAILELVEAARDGRLSPAI
jgi:predicted Fe-Mo cluster-binding NifX family protein